MRRWTLLLLLLIGTLLLGCDRTASSKSAEVTEPTTPAKNEQGGDDAQGADISAPPRARDEGAPDKTAKQETDEDRLPTFDAYPVDEEFDGEPAAIDFDSNPDAKRFRTRLTQALESHDEHRFAGHYTVAVWGCGAPCQQCAIIDLRDGDVTFGPTASLGYDYRPDSRLFVVNPRKEGEPVGAVHGPTEYHLFEQGEFRKLAEHHPSAD